MTSGRRRHFLPLIAVALAALALAACSDGSYSYVKGQGGTGTNGNVYFKLPKTWKLFSQKSKPATDTVATTSAVAAGTWQVIFDADPKPSTDHVKTSAAASFPTGMATIEPLTQSEHDLVSTRALRMMPGFSSDPLEGQEPGVDVVKYDDISRADGYRGMHMVTNQTLSSGAVVTVDRTTIIDAQATTLYDLRVICTSTCYSANKKSIDDIVSSWTVRKP